MIYYIYTLQELTPSQFKNKYGLFPFSKAFPNWVSTICNGNMQIKTTEKLPNEIVEKYNLIYVKEVTSK